MTVMIPELCLTEEEAADRRERAKRGRDCSTITIGGHEVILPPEPFTDGRKRQWFYPGPLVFQVYARKGVCVGAFKDLEGARRLMRKRGRNAGHVLHVCVDYSPRGFAAPIISRICLARVNRRSTPLLWVQYGNAVYPAETTAQRSNQ